MNKFLKIILSFCSIFLFSACTYNNKTVIVIDAAHTESDTGLNGIITEYSYTKSLGDALTTLLENDDTYEVIYLYDLSLSKRVQEIKNDHVDAVITLHASASSDTNTTGMHVIAEANDKSSLKLAETIATKLDNAMLCYAYYEPIKENVYEEKYISTTEEYDTAYETMELMEALDIPVVQFEGLYVTSQEDVDLMTSEEMINTVANKIYSAIQEVYP